MDPTPLARPLLSLLPRIIVEKIWPWRLARIATRSMSPRPVRALAVWLRRPDVRLALESQPQPPLKLGPDLDLHLGLGDRTWAGLADDLRRQRTSRIIDVAWRELVSTRRERTNQIVSGRVAQSALGSRQDLQRIGAQVEDLASALQPAAITDDETDFQERLRQLPPYRRDELRRCRPQNPAEIRRLVTALTEPSDTPHRLLSDWFEAGPPSWLLAADAGTLIVAAKLAADYAVLDLASVLWRAAVASGAPNSHHWIGRAALALSDHDDALAVLQHISTPTESSEPLVRALHAILTKDWDLARSTLSSWTDASSEAIILRYQLWIHFTFLSGHERVVTPDMLQEASRHAKQVLDDLRDDPDRTCGVSLALARFTLMLVSTGSAEHPAGALADSRRRSEDVRGRRRSWRGDSAEAVALATQAALIAGDCRAVLRLGLPRDAAQSVSDGRGEAIDMEASHPDVRRNVYLAQLQLGLARELPDLQGLPAFHEHSMRAMHLELTGGDAHHEWTQALLGATDDEETITAAVNIARLGTLAQSPSLQAILVEFPAIAALITARQLAAHGQASEAISHLRPAAMSFVAATLTLAELYFQTKQIDQLLKLTGTAADRFANPDLCLIGVMALREAGRLDEAVALLNTLLQTAELEWAGRAETLRIAAQVQLDRQDHPAAFDYLQAAVRIDPFHSPARWALVQLWLERGEPIPARRVIEAAPMLVPTDVRSAVDWLQVFLNTTPGLQQAQLAVELAESFPDSEDVQGRVVWLIVRGQFDELPTSLEVQIAQITDRFFLRWPDSRLIRQITVDEDDPADLFRKIEEWIRLSPEQLARRRQLHRLVARARLPLGMLALDARRSYTEVLFARGLGHIGTWHLQADQRRADREATVDPKAVVIDLSSLVALQRLAPEIRSRILAHLPVPGVTDSSWADLHRGVEFFQQRSFGYFAYDEIEHRTLVVEGDESRAQTLVRDVLEVQEMAGDLRRIRDVLHPGAGEERQQRDPWFSSFATAAATSAVLWADDPFLREAARSLGAQAFSTGDLLERLTDIGVLSVSQLADQLRLLLCAGFQPQLTVPLFRTGVEVENYEAGGVAAGMANPGLWLEAAAGNRWFLALLEQMPRADPEAIAGWLYYAVRGVAFAHDDPATVASTTAPLLAGALYTGTQSGIHTPLMVAAARRALAEASLDATAVQDPLGQSVRLLYENVRKSAPASTVAQWVFGLTRALSDIDQRTAARAILLAQD